MGSKNPNSIRYTPLRDGESEGRSKRRAHINLQATEASEGDAGLEQKKAARRALGRGVE